MAICGGIVLEEALNLSSDRLLDVDELPSSYTVHSVNSSCAAGVY